MKKHFVHFYWPGALVAEDTTREVKSWDAEEALKMVDKMVEKGKLAPFAFNFSTRGRSGTELDSKEIKRSGMYHLGGEVFTQRQIANRAREDERILLSNMKCNGYKRIIVNCNSWKWTSPLEEDDVVLPWPRTCGKETA